MRASVMRGNMILATFRIVCCRHNANELHHASIFMSKNVAMEYEGSGKIQERMTDDDPARRNHTVLDSRSRDCNHILPDVVVLWLVDLSWSVVVRLFNP